MFSLVPWRNRGGERGVAQREDPLALMRREFDSIFDRFFGSGSGYGEWSNPGWGLDVEDTGQALAVRAEAPGFEAGDFNVELQGDVLHLSAERKQEAKEDGGTSSRYGRFERWVSVPSGIDPQKVEARYRNGVLEVTLPRSKEALGRKIEVKG